MRLRYGGSATQWGFAAYLASKDGYEDSFLPSGHTADHRKTLSTPCSASTSTIPPPGTDPTNFRSGPLA